LSLPSAKNYPDYPLTSFPTHHGSFDQPSASISAPLLSSSVPNTLAFASPLVPTHHDDDSACMNMTRTRASADGAAQRAYALCHESAISWQCS
jgi:hypothetical protein